MQLSKIYFPHIFPLLCLITGLVLVTLCIVAGNAPGFMEDYALVRFDMSGLGNNFFTNTNDTSSDSDDKDKNKDKDDDDEDDDSIFDRIGDKIGDKIDSGKEKARDKFDEIGNDLADGLSDKLNLSGWYSLHVLTYCEGEWKNETGNGGRGMEVKKCSEPSPSDRFNIADILNGTSLTVGPLEIPIPSGIQRQVSKLNSVLRALLILYAISTTLAGLALLTNVASLALPHIRPYEVTMANAALSSSAALFLFMGSAATTVAGVLTAGALGDLGEIVGIRVVKGEEFVSITWAAFGVVAVAAAYWMWALWKVRREAWDRDGEVRRLKGELAEAVKRAKGRRKESIREKSFDG